MDLEVSEQNNSDTRTLVELKTQVVKRHSEGIGNNAITKSQTYGKRAINIQKLDDDTPLFGADCSPEFRMKRKIGKRSLDPAVRNA